MRICRRLYSASLAFRVNSSSFSLSSACFSAAFTARALACSSAFCALSAAFSAFCLAFVSPPRFSYASLASFSRCLAFLRSSWRDDFSLLVRSLALALRSSSCTALAACSYSRCASLYGLLLLALSFSFCCSWIFLARSSTFSTLRIIPSRVLMYFFPLFSSSPRILSTFASAAFSWLSLMPVSEAMNAAWLSSARFVSCCLTALPSTLRLPPL